MGQIVIRQLDDAVLDAVKSRAKANNRSAEAEVRAIISNAVKAPVQTSPKKRKRLSDLVGSIASGRTAEEIVMDIRVLRDEWED
ncbi:hypothetical protein [Hoeflea sp.]|uniref:FitA-like ribbon-helix-helix domain-containing protein n=1 Tax=Hoeflea sp. TaxID=1940281 RepID=UPI0025C613AE|nr:hypothetical protein [Hoeflea sp.]